MKMGVESQSNDTVMLLADEVKVFHLKKKNISIQGVDGGQGQRAKELQQSIARRYRLGHVQISGTDPCEKERTCGYDHGVEEENCDRIADHLSPHHPPASHQLCDHIL